MNRRPFRVEYACDYSQRTTTHATLGSAITAATEAVNAAKINRRPEAFISYAGAGGWATVTRAGVDPDVPDWFEVGA